jgi:hypothetical protein
MAIAERGQGSSLLVLCLFSLHTHYDQEPNGDAKTRTPI